jgi:hypothetical protein
VDNFGIIRQGSNALPLPAIKLSAPRHYPRTHGRRVIAFPIQQALALAHALKKDEPRPTQFVDHVLLDLEKSGEAQKIFDVWFAGAKRTFRIQPD